jgi:hypothetical protein
MSHTKPTSSPNRTNFLAQPDTMSEDHQQLMAYISGRRMFKVVKGAMKKIGAGDLFKEFEQTLDIKLINKMKTTAAAKDRELTQAQRTTVNILLFGASGERAAVSVSVEPPRVMSPLAKHQQAPLERTSANKNGGVAQTDLKRKHAGVESMMDSSDDESDDESDDDSEDDDDDDDEENFKNATQDATADEDDEYADALGDDDEIDREEAHRPHTATSSSSGCSFDAVAQTRVNGTGGDRERLRGAPQSALST